MPKSREERFQERVSLASEMMKAAMKEVHSVLNDRDNSVFTFTIDNYHAYVQAHMNLQVQLYAQHELKESVYGIDTSNAFPDLSKLESVMRNGLAELKDPIDSIDETLSSLVGCAFTINER